MRTRREFNIKEYNHTSELYKEFKIEVKLETKVTNYYSVIIACAQDILWDISDNTSAQVAMDLGLAPTKLSHMTMILKALVQNKEV